MQLFRTILVAADFSENSVHAFRMACALAVENKTRLVLLHVIEPNLVAEEPTYLGQPTVPFYGAQRDADNHQYLRRKMREVYVPIQPLDVEYRTTEGAASTEIVRMADEIGADLIVMGTHGYTGIRWLLAGSVAIAVLRGAHCPVLALHAHELPSKPEAIRVILHPTDFSDGSEAAAEVARSLARDLGAQLILLHVAPLKVLMDGTLAAESDPRYYHDALNDARSRLDGPDLKYPVETRLAHGFEAEEILTMEQEVRCDLIVMGTHGRTGLTRYLMGSVAETVLPKADCPVMVVKASRQVPAPTQDQPAVEMATAT